EPETSGRRQLQSRRGHAATGDDRHGGAGQGARQGAVAAAGDGSPAGRAIPGRRGEGEGRRPSPGARQAAARVYQTVGGGPEVRGKGLTGAPLVPELAGRAVGYLRRRSRDLRQRLAAKREPRVQLVSERVRRGTRVRAE